MSTTLDAKMAEARRLRALGWTYRKIAGAVGCVESTVGRYLNDANYGRRPASERISGGIDRVARLDAQRMLRRVPVDDRSVTSRLMGDPLPGRGAGPARCSLLPLGWRSPICNEAAS